MIRLRNHTAERILMNELRYTTNIYTVCRTDSEQASIVCTFFAAFQFVELAQMILFYCHIIDRLVICTSTKNTIF